MLIKIFDRAKIQKIFRKTKNLTTNVSQDLINNRNSPTSFQNQ